MRIDQRLQFIVLLFAFLIFFYIVKPFDVLNLKDGRLKFRSIDIVDTVKSWLHGNANEVKDSCDGETKE